MAASGGVPAAQQAGRISGQGAAARIGRGRGQDGVVGAYGFGASLDANALTVFQPSGGVDGGPVGGLPPAWRPVPSLIFGAGPLPRCPLVIKIDRGLAQPAQTRVVSGRPGCV